ncbi:hypothetical protein PG997_005509 [Apiospora hydei]|uniref:Cytochrome P450 n=1 Tax=Apiospora hydei TaxID=1337664 RepID=A0ABR1WL55_9PEZI
MAVTEALNYPGPFLAKFTDAYGGGYHAVKKRLHLATYDGHHKYDIYLNPSTNKAQIYRHSQFNPQHNIFGTLDKERHRQKRKVYGRMLSERSLRVFEPTMTGEIDTFLDQLAGSGRGGEPVNMTPLCERLTADVAGELAFGQPLRTQTETANRVFPRAMLSMNFLVSLFMTWPALSTTWPLLRRLNRKNGAVFQSVVRKIIAARMKLPQDAKHDFYSICADSTYSEEEEGLGQSELWAEAVFIIPAGALFPPFPFLTRWDHLESRPERHFLLPVAQPRLVPQARDRDPDEVLLGKRHTQRSGAFRVQIPARRDRRVPAPVAALPRDLTFWREQQAPFTEPPLVVDGRVIPAGVAVGVNPYCLMHNEAYFPDAFRFQPERWLAPEPEEGEHEDANGGEKEQEQEQKQAQKASRATMRKVFAPFSLGEASCLGKGMAYLEISLTVAKTLWRFDFEKAPGELGQVEEGRPGMKDGARRRAGEYQLFDISTADHDGPYLVFRRREGGSGE